MYNGLSLDQAPPISVVLRFFLTVPVFGLLLSALIFLQPHEVLTLNHPISLSAIHLMFLGVVTMAMIGALFQMQSVLGGAPIPAPLGNALLIHLFLILGTLSLVGGFLSLWPPLFVIGSVFLGSALLYAVFLILPLLLKGSSHDTLRGMRGSLIALGITAVLGILMASGYANGTLSPSHEAIRSAHYSLGLIGWVGTLIVAVAFQVVEMFYVTEPYSRWCKRNAFRILAAALVLKTLWLFVALPYVWVADLVMGAILIGFVATTMKRLRGRKRRVRDVSIWFWEGGMALLAISIAAYAASWWQESFALLSLLSFALFALAIILGMMSKIVPFLVWFHLNSAGYMDAPIMSNVIPSRRSQILFVLFTLMSLFLLGGVFIIEFLAVGGLVGATLFGQLFYNLLKAVGVYRTTVKNGMKFESIG
jgi:hypothetical protein